MKVDLQKAIKHVLKKAVSPPDNKSGIDYTYTEFPHTTEYFKEAYRLKNCFRIKNYKKRS